MNTCLIVIALIVIFDFRNFEGTPVPTCPSVPEFEVPKNLDFFEKPVIGEFKVWQLAFMAAACGLIIIIVLCCIFRCRIPRTKQEIEADFKRRKITKQFRKHLNKIPVDEVELIKVLPKVQDLEEQRIRKGLTEEKLTLRDRIKAIFSTDDESISIEKQSIEEEGEDEEKQSSVDKESLKEEEEWPAENQLSVKEKDGD